MRPSEYCTQCGHVGPPTEVWESELGCLFWFLFLLGVIPAIIYWLCGGGKHWILVCEKCKNRGTLVPLDSPTAKTALKKAHQTLPDKPLAAKLCPFCGKTLYTESRYCDGCGRAIYWKRCTRSGAKGQKRVIQSAMLLKINKEGMKKRTPG